MDKKSKEYNFRIIVNKIFQSLEEKSLIDNNINNGFDTSGNNIIYFQHTSGLKVRIDITENIGKNKFIHKKS